MPDIIAFRKKKIIVSFRFSLTFFHRYERQKIDGIVKTDYPFDYNMKQKNKEFSKIKLKADEEVRILRTITRTISYNLNLEEVLKQIVDIVTQFMKGDSCLLYLFDERKEELV